MSASGRNIAFSVIIIIVLVIDYAAQYQPPDHEAPSDAMDVADQRDQGDDAA